MTKLFIELAKVWKGFVMVKLDELDLKIVDVLQENARTTNADVAKLVGSTEPTVRRRSG